MKGITIAEAMIFVKKFAEKRFGVTLAEKPEEVKDAGDNQTNIEFKVQSFGKNLLFSEYMKDAQVEFELIDDKHGIFIRNIAISFSFKDGGGNGWIHPTAFMQKKNGDFVEKETT